MTTDAFKASGLDHDTLILVWLAALVALDAPTDSYLMNLGAATQTAVRAWSESTRSSRHSHQSSGPPASSLRPPESWRYSAPALDPERPSEPLGEGASAALVRLLMDRPAVDGATSRWAGRRVPRERGHRGSRSTTERLAADGGPSPTISLEAPTPVAHSEYVRSSHSPGYTNTVETARKLRARFGAAPSHAGSRRAH